MLKDMKNARLITCDTRRQTGEEVYEYLKHRNVTFLVHFTPKNNWKSILEHGICSRNFCENNKIEYIPTDKDRMDNCRDYSSFSIAFPNYLMRYQKELDGIETIILLIKIEVLKELNSDDIKLFSKNAATNIDEENNISDLFNEQITYKGKNTTRAELRLPSIYTSNPQAEVMIKKNIDPKYIKYVVKKVTLYWGVVNFGMIHLLTILCQMTVGVLQKN